MIPGIVAGGPVAAAPPSGAHRYWRIYITSADGGSFKGFTQIQMATSIGGTNLIVAQGSNGPPLYFSSEVNSANAAWMATNSLVTEGWLSIIAATPEWWAYDFGSDTAIVSVVISGSYNSPPSSPKDFTIEYSDDNSNWAVAHTVTGETGWTGAADVRTFNF